MLTPKREYPDPAERWEELHREEREWEREYDDYLLDEDFDDEEGWY